MEEIMYGICCKCGSRYDTRASHECNPKNIPAAFEEITKDGVRIVDTVTKAEYEKLSTPTKEVVNAEKEVV